MAFDLSSLVLKDTAVVHLQHPETQELLYADEAKKKPVTIEIYGTSSKVYRAALSEMQKRNVARGKSKVSLEVMLEESIEHLAAVSIRSQNLTNLDKSPLDSVAAFKVLYSNEGLKWIREQVDTALSTTATFLQK